MATKNELLLEKRRYGLPEVISKKELELLNKGFPIQKIMGFINFTDVKINLNRNVLIPRYETEEVINKSLEFINENSDVLDLCCGSGFIGLTIKKRTDANVTLSDIDPEAILATKENALVNNNMKVNIIKSDLFSEINDKFDVIVSNPPYIPKNNELNYSVTEFEPHHALFAGKDGNDFYKVICKEAPKYLKNNGYLILEVSPDNSKYIESLGFDIFQDINKKDRIAVKKYKKQ